MANNNQKSIRRCAQKHDGNTYKVANQTGIIIPQHIPQTYQKRLSKFPKVARSAAKIAAALGH